MKKLFFIIGLFLSVSSFGQTAISFSFFDKDSVKFVPQYSPARVQGEEIIVRVTFNYIYPQDASNPFVIKLYDQTIFDGTVQDWLDTGFSIHIILPVLPAVTNYTYPVYLNDISKSALHIVPQTTTSIINPVTETNIKIEYFDMTGLKIEKPSKGFSIWKAENGESGKVFIY